MVSLVDVTAVGKSVPFFFFSPRTLVLDLAALGISSSEELALLTAFEVLGLLGVRIAMSV